MRKDLYKTIQICADFLQIDYKLTINDLNRMYEHLKFDKMKSNPAVNLDPIIKNFHKNNNNYNKNQNNNDNDNDENNDVKFIRKGQIGDWKNHISEELSKKFDKWIEKNTKESDLTFEYE